MPVSSRRLLASLCMSRIYKCVWATLLRPIWRILNLYRFPFPGLCFPSLELRHAAMQPPPSSPRNTISLINGSPPQNTAIKTTDKRATHGQVRAHLLAHYGLNNRMWNQCRVGFFPPRNATVSASETDYSSMRRLKVHRRLTSLSSLCIPHPHWSGPRTPL